MAMKIRVTVTVRQDGREIVCSLSAVTVFFVFRETFLSDHVLFGISVLRIVRYLFQSGKKLATLHDRMLSNLQVWLICCHRREVLQTNFVKS